MRLQYFQVEDRSMEPAVRPGDFVRVQRKVPILEGDVVVARVEGRLMIKRVKRVREGAYWLLGDNRRESYDSRSFNWVPGKEVLGRARVFHRPNWLTSGILQ